MLIDEIKKEFIVAFKNKDEQARVALNTIKSKYMLVEVENRASNKETTDQDTVRILLKTIKELDEEMENYKKVNNAEEAENVRHQKETLERFVPKMMSVEEIKKEIMTLENKTVPFVMKHFKMNFEGKVNMQDVNIALKELNN